MNKKNVFSYLFSILGERKRKKHIELQLSTDRIEELKSQLGTLMENKKPFLQKGYHMKDMAEELQIPLYQLSAFMNGVIGMRFTDYINKFRVGYCEELMKTFLDVKPNLKELACQCGFNNRNSFADAFRKFTGQNPSDYLRRL